MSRWCQDDGNMMWKRCGYELTFSPLEDTLRSGGIITTTTTLQPHLSTIQWEYEEVKMNIQTNITLLLPPSPPPMKPDQGWRPSGLMNEVRWWWGWWWEGSRWWRGRWWGGSGWWGSSGLPTSDITSSSCGYVAVEIRGGRRGGRGEWGWYGWYPPRWWGWGWSLGGGYHILKTITRC